MGKKLSLCFTLFLFSLNGFCIDKPITRQMLQEKILNLDHDGFNELLSQLTKDEVTYNWVASDLRKTLLKFHLQAQNGFEEAENSHKLSTIINSMWSCLNTGFFAFQLSSDPGRVELNTSILKYQNEEYDLLQKLNLLPNLPPLQNEDPTDYALDLTREEKERLEREYETRYIQENVQGQHLQYYPDYSIGSFGDHFVGRVDKRIEELRVLLRDKTNRIKRYDKQVKQSALLYGPPGTGKTTLAGAIGADNHYPFFKLLPSAIESKYFAETEQRLSEILSTLYNYAEKKNTKVILFIDEIDALLSNRGKEGSNTEDRNNKILSVFLNFFGERTGSDSTRDFLEKVILIGATNYPEKIPAAAYSRFFYKIKMPNPDKDQRIQVLKHHLGKIDSELVSITENEIKELASERMEGLNCRQIADIVKMAGRSVCVQSILEDELPEDRKTCDGIVRLKDLELVIEREEYNKKDQEDDTSYRHMYL